MIIPELKVGTYVQVDCNAFIEINDTIRTGEISKLNEDGTYDIKIGKFLYPSCDRRFIAAYSFKIDELVEGLHVKLIPSNIDGRILAESVHSLCFDIKAKDRVINDVHYDFFRPVYQIFVINEKVCYKDTRGKIVNTIDDLWYEIRLESGIELRVPEFELTKLSEHNRMSLLKWLENLK